MTSKLFEQDKVLTENELLSIVGKPSKLAENKVITYLDDNCRNFINMSPFLVLSTSNEKGECDASPRGDHPGFIKVLDDHHILIPERPGNKRLDSIKNILSNSQVGLLFFIPSLEETLRINGKAWITKNNELLESLSVNGRSPLLGICIEVEECFIHCAKALKRSHLWKTETWPENSTLPSPAKILAEHAKLPGVKEKEVTELLKESYTERLY